MPSAARAALNAEEFVCVDANVERELVNARAIRVVRVERGERVCVLDDGEATNANVGAPANRGETSTEGSPSGPPPAKMMGATNQDVLGMLSGIMKGASPRILRKEIMISFALHLVILYSFTNTMLFSRFFCFYIQS